MRQLLRCGNAAQCIALFHAFRRDRGLAVALLVAAVQQRRIYRARADRIHADIVHRQLHGQRFAEHDERGFGCAIGAAIAKRCQPGCRGNVDDGAGAAGAQIGCSRTAHQHGAGEIDGQSALPIGGGQCFQWAQAVDACGVDYGVNAAQCGSCVLDGLLYSIGIGHVACLRMPWSAVERLLVDVHDTDHGSLLRGELRHCQANAAGAADDEEAAACKELLAHCATAFRRGRMSSDITSQRSIHTFGCDSACSIRASSTLRREGWPMISGCMPSIIIRSSS